MAAIERSAIGIGLLGCGTVGRGVLETLAAGKERFAARLGRPLAVRRILVRDLEKPRGDLVPRGLLTTNFEAVLRDPEIDVIVEVMGGVEPAHEYLKTAFAAGKHVVTANKELLAKRGAELLAAANRAAVSLRFEASVAGGIPILKALRESLAANSFTQVMGIVNGTTNFILTAMSETGQDFAEALEEARALGYAEADPSSDIEGHDAAYKLAILAAAAFRIQVRVENIYREGISAVAASDITYARELGYAIKLLAVAHAARAKEPRGNMAALRAGTDANAGAVGLWVRPSLVPLRHPLAAVKNSFNAVFVSGDAAGELMFYGRGAGSLPTASAVVGDLLEVAGIPRGAGAGAGSWADSESWQVAGAGRLVPVEDVERQFYVRTSVADRPGVLARIAGLFGSHGVSLSTVIQKGTDRPSVPLVFVTHRIPEGNLRAALREIAELPVVDRIDSVMPLENGESGEA